MKDNYYHKRCTYKSKGEYRIAGFLEERDIDFEYEYPLAIRDHGHVKIWYPDFTLPQYNMIIEYFGINGNRTYDEQTAHKLFTYKQAGIDGIYLTESSFSGPWKERILDTIGRSLEGKLQKISSVSRSNRSRLAEYSTHHER